MAIIPSKEDLKNCSPGKLLRRKKYSYNKFCLVYATNKDKRKSNIRNEKGNEKIIKKNVKMMLKTVDKNRRKEYTKTQEIGK